MDAWITGIRREQSPTRADAPKEEWMESRGVWKFNPLADWTEDDVWRYVHEHDLPYHPLHDQRLRLHRLRSLHASRRRPRRPLGRAGEDGVRAARMTSR